MGISLGRWYKAIINAKVIFFTPNNMIYYIEKTKEWTQYLPNKNINRGGRHGLFYKTSMTQELYQVDRTKVEAHMIFSVIYTGCVQDNITRRSIREITFKEKLTQLPQDARGVVIKIEIEDDGKYTTKYIRISKYRAVSDGFYKKIGGKGSF